MEMGLGIDIKLLGSIINDLMKIFILAIALERALYQVFETKIWKKLEELTDKAIKSDILDLKPWISIIIAYILVQQLGLDLIQTIMDSSTTKAAEGSDTNHFSFLHKVITALFLAGGSTGVYKFLRRVRNVKEAEAENKVTTAEAPATTNQNTGS